MAEADRAALRVKLAATIERGRADDPKILRTETADLKRQLSPRLPPNPTRQPHSGRWSLPSKSGPVLKATRRRHVVAGRSLVGRLAKSPRWPT